MEEKNNSPGVQNPAMMLAKRLRENNESLRVARIPEKTKKAFVDLAQKEFCGDYGMTLKWLMDDIISQDTKVILLKLEEFEGRIRALEERKDLPQEEVKEKKKFLDGSERRTKEQ